MNVWAVVMSCDLPGTSPRLQQERATLGFCFVAFLLVSVVMRLPSAFIKKLKRFFSNLEVLTLLGKSSKQAILICTFFFSLWEVLLRSQLKTEYVLVITYSFFGSSGQFRSRTEIQAVH